MSAWLSTLVWKEAPGEPDGVYDMVEPLSYQSDYAKQIFTVPAGERVDGNSTPRLPLVYWATGGMMHKECAVHDFLYRSKIVSRSMADAVLREAVALRGMSGWRRGAMWAGVRLFGWSRWNKAKTETAAVESENEIY